VPAKFILLHLILLKNPVLVSGAPAVSSVRFAILPLWLEQL
jgi:hypothetical protein